MPHDLGTQRRGDIMGKVLELSDETYHQLADLAQQQQRTPEEMLRVCLATYEAALYERVHQQMRAEGLLEALPTRPLPPDVEDFDPEEIPGPPLSETILEERRSCPRMWMRAPWSNATWPKSARPGCGGSWPIRRST